MADLILMLFCLWVSRLLLWPANARLPLYVVCYYRMNVMWSITSTILLALLHQKTLYKFTKMWLLQELGLQQSASKACPPSPVLTCLGVQVNSLDLTLSVHMKGCTNSRLCYFHGQAGDRPQNPSFNH